MLNVSGSVSAPVEFIFTAGDITHLPLALC